MAPPTFSDEIAFISGVAADGTLPVQAYAGWNASSNPATYSGEDTNSRKWGGVTAGSAGGTVRYYFNPASNWQSSSNGGAPEQEFLVAGLALWSAIANISFVRTTDAAQAQITFTRSTDREANTTLTYSGPSTAGNTGGTRLYTIQKAEISIDTSSGGFGPIDGTFARAGGSPINTFLHEEGHALGLGHAGPYNTNADVATQQFSPYDTTLWSIMSYIDPRTSNAKYASEYPVTGTNWGVSQGFLREPTTWMPLDIWAAQRLYGLPTSSPLSGGQTFGFNCNIAGPIGMFFDFTKNTAPVITLWSMGGNNTLDVSGWSTSSTVNLNPGTFSSCGGLTNNICIAFGTAIDTFIGGSGNDFVFGNSNGNALYGGSGNDTLIGRSANDVFNGGLGNDSIDGDAGTDTVLFSSARSAYTFSQNSNGEYTISGADGTDTIIRIELLTFSDRTFTISQMLNSRTFQPNDFDGNGKPDLLMQYNDGRFAVWLLDGSRLVRGGLVGSPGAAWHGKDSGDFNGDGKADILMQHDDSSIAVWQVDGTSFAGGNLIGNAPGISWHVRAAADFSGDGKADILMQNDDSRIAVWEVHDVSFAGGVIVGNAPGAAWKTKGAGDFDGNGKSDLVLQRDSGEIAVWQMDGTSFAGGGITGAPGASWHVKSVADFNGDGKADLLLQHDDSSVAVWQMNGTSMAGAGLIATPGAAWQVQGAADHDGNGKADIVLQRTSGEIAIWYVSGTTLMGGVEVGNPGSLWSLVGPTGA